MFMRRHCRRFIPRFLPCILTLCLTPIVGAHALTQGLPPALAIMYGREKYDTILILRGQSIHLAIYPTLPSKEGETPGVWRALFGTVSANGSYYTAPKKLPPAQMDVITFIPSGSDLPKFQIWFSVLGEGAPPQWARGKRVKHLKHTEISPIANPEDKISGYVAPILPEDEQTYRIYIPKREGADPVTCERTGPVNPPPARPDGSKTKIQVSSEFATFELGKDEGEEYDKTTTSLRNVTPEQHDKIQREYAVDIPAGLNPAHFEVQNTSECRLSWVDSYDLARDGKSWILAKTSLYCDLGVKKIYEPNWMSVIYNAPPHGEIEWDGQDIAALFTPKSNP